MDFLSRTPNLSGDTEEDARLILDYTVQRFDELRYYLNNLDKDNFNDVAWNNVVADIVNIAAGSITIDTGSIEIALTEMEGRLNGKIEASSNGLRTEFADADKALGKELSSSISQSASNLTVAYQEADTKLNTDLSAKIQVNANGISSVVSSVNSLDGKVDKLDTKVGTYNSRITQNASSISAIVTSVGSDGTVTAASIVTAINADNGSTVKIKADCINLEGVTTFVKPSDLGEEGTTVINGARIETGTLSANKISGGTLEGITLISSNGSWWDQVKIENGSIYFGDATISNTDSRLLSIRASGVEIQSPFDGFAVYVQGQTSWHFSSAGLYFKDSVGNKKYVAFQ